MNIKATGIVRRVDDLGRVVIPKEVRTSLAIKEGDPLEIHVGEGGFIVLKKYQQGCVFCGDAGVVEFGEMSICSSCLEGIRLL